jgi:hypothetical protein
MVDARITRPSRSGARLERLRRGWVFRDAGGRGWWLDDTVAANGAHRVVPAGHPSAQFRVFTPMVGARGTARRIHEFGIGEDHAVALRAVAAQHARATSDPA